MKIIKKGKKITLDFEQNVFFLEKEESQYNERWLKLLGILPENVTLANGIFIYEGSRNFGSTWKINGEKYKYICKDQHLDTTKHLFYNSKMDCTVLIDINES